MITVQQSKDFNIVHEIKMFTLFTSHPRNYIFNFCLKQFYEYFFFRFACQGLKKLPLDNREKIFQLVKVSNF